MVLTSIEDKFTVRALVCQVYNWVSFLMSADACPEIMSRIKDIAFPSANLTDRFPLKWKALGERKRDKTKKPQSRAELIKRRKALELGFEAGGALRRTGGG